VRELDAGCGATRMDGLDDRHPGVALLIVPQPDIVG
jgi:hypothetical protein